MKKLVLIASSVVAFIMLTGCVNKKGPAKENKEPEETLFAVNAQIVKNSSLDDYLEFGGDVDSVSSVSVLPDMAGKLSSVKVSLGDSVKKDQVIAYVDASRPGYNYSESPVKAPVAGRIVSLVTYIGTTVSQSMPVAKISNTDEMEIKINVPERFISRVKTGQRVELTFDAYPGEIFGAKVSEVSPVLDTASRTMQAKVRITQHSNKIKIGMYARVKLITESHNNTMVVASTTIVSRDGNPYIFVIDEVPVEGKARVVQRPVTVGITVDDKTEVVQGLNVGEMIVVKGQTLLNDGAKVNIIKTAE